MKLVDTWDGPTAEIGAANPLSRTADGRVLASNSDAVGFEYATRDLGLADARVLVLGAGGAARAVLTVLFARGAHVAIANRTADRARSLARSVSHPSGQVPRSAAWPRPAHLPAFHPVLHPPALRPRAD